MDRIDRTIYIKFCLTNADIQLDIKTCNRTVKTCGN